MFLKFLISLFFVMSLFSVPSMIFYFYGSSNNITDSKSVLTTFSLGNLGQEDAACNTGKYSTTMNGVSNG
jgi:hypothetical protein